MVSVSKLCFSFPVVSFLDSRVMILTFVNHDNYDKKLPAKSLSLSSTTDVRTSPKNTFDCMLQNLGYKSTIKALGEVVKYQN